MFSPLVSVILVVLFWPMNIYADLKWVRVMPQDVAAILAIWLQCLCFCRNIKFCYMDDNYSGSFGELVEALKIKI